MTKLQAYIKCKKMWTWLRDNPKKRKMDYPGIEYVANYCFACQYDLEHKYFNCFSKCILANIWPNGCTMKPSPYRDWLDATKKEKKKYCQAIIDGCDFQIKKLRKKK